MRILLVALFALLITACTNFASEKKTLHVKGGDIYTAAGELLVMRGFNEMFVWSDDPTGEQLIPQINQSGANSLRIVWDYSADISGLKLLIDKTIAHKMVAIPECHNATGKWGEALQACIDFWNDEGLIQAIESNKQWSIVNIANEAGDHSISDDQFIEAYTKAISSLRQWGYTVPIMIDAAGWGQNVDQLLRVGPTLLKHDPLKNIIFSTHSYWAADVALDNYKKVAITARQKGLSMIIGEGPSVTRVGQCDNPEPLPYLEGMEILQLHNVGWLNWSWGGMKNGDCDDFRYFDITKDGQFGYWWHTPGKNIVALDRNSVMRTSIRPKSFYPNRKVIISGIYLHVKKKTITVGENTGFEVIISPANAENKNYKVSIAGDKHAIHFDKNEGKVYGVSKGSAELIVVTESGNIQWREKIKVIDKDPKNKD